jgi:hypothetical protein
MMIHSPAIRTAAAVHIHSEIEKMKYRNATVMLNTIINGIAIILSKILIRKPLSSAAFVLSYLYFTIRERGQQCCRGHTDLVPSLRANLARSKTYCSEAKKAV